MGPGNTDVVPGRLCGQEGSLIGGLRPTGSWSLFGGWCGTGRGSRSAACGYARASSVGRRGEKSGPPCAQVASTWTPYQRVVRVNQVFRAEDFQWNKGDGVSDELLPDARPDGRPNTQPDGREDQWQDGLDPKSCAT